MASEQGNGRLHRGFPVLLSFAALVVAVAVASLFGSSALSLHGVLSGNGPEREIFMALRVPRALLAALAGGSLALSGVLFQALLRNSLADPYTLGVSSGASLGAVIAICLGWEAVAGVSAVMLSALAGAGLVMFAIYRIATREQMSSASLLLAGITINTICFAITIFLTSISSLLQSFMISHWLMGSLDSPKYSALAVVALLLVLTACVIWRFANSWNLLALGEDWANIHGVSAHKLLIAGYILGSLLAGTVTAFTGPIGFVGLIVPHALRLWLGADHRVLIPCSFLIGGAFIAVGDLVSRTILAPTETPIGVITAMLGGPAFIWMIYSRDVRHHT